VTEESIAIDKLRHIEELWEKLKGAKTNTDEYKALIKEIGILSVEYQKLVDATEQRK
jgi:hypothetical protein